MNLDFKDYRTISGAFLKLNHLKHLLKFLKRKFPPFFSDREEIKSENLISFICKSPFIIIFLIYLLFVFFSPFYL